MCRQGRRSSTDGPIETKAEIPVLNIVDAGCTEIPLLVKQKDVSVPAFDTMPIHSAAAVRNSLGEEE
jgi:aspartate/glutamate racemase